MIADITGVAPGMMLASTRAHHGARPVVNIPVVAVWGGGGVRCVSDAEIMGHAVLQFLRVIAVRYE